MKASLIDKMGSDLTVVNAARVSFDKESDWEWSHDGNGDVRVLADKDVKLINYLAKHEHWTPFAHPHLTIHVKAPIFVARQLFKHKVGLVENEVSRRYVDYAPELYVPTAWRKRAADKKQGSSAEAYNGFISTGGFGTYVLTPEGVQRDAVALYEHMIAIGVCPEQARMVLPQSMYTEWHWTGSLYAFFGVCQKRLKDDAQAETREIAWDIAHILMEHFPVSWGALYAHQMPHVTLPAKETCYDQA